MYNKRYRSQFWREISEIHHKRLEDLISTLEDDLKHLSNIALGGLINEAYLMKYDKNCSRHVWELEASENIAKAAENILNYRRCYYSSIFQKLETWDGKLIKQYKTI
jgi:hypothetical protein